MPEPNVYISPNRVTSIGLKEDENMIFEVRSSIIPIIMTLSGFIILFLLYYFLISQVRYIMPGNLFTYLFWGGLGVIVLVAGGFFLNWFIKKYRLTTERVEQHAGIIFSYDNSIALDEIEKITLKRSLMGKISNYGTITIKSAPTFDMQIKFENISNPSSRLRQIKDAIK